MNSKWSELVKSHSSQLRLTPMGLEYVLSVVTSAPSRNPTNTSGRNLIVDYASRKMGHTHALESLTVETAYAEMLELVLPCIGYWPQPNHIPTQRVGRDQVSRRIRRTFDFLVMYPDRVELVECKKEVDLLTLSLEFPDRFKRSEEGKWTSPEAERALTEYGILSRVVSDGELNPILLRNYTILAEAKQNDYSSTKALEQIYECFSTNNEGVPLAELIGRAGTNFTKNDVYLGILRRDLHVPLSDCLLVDDRTTRVFNSEVHAEAYRLLNYQPKPTPTKPLVVKQGTRLRWNGTDYTVCNASPAKIYLQPKTGAPIPMHRQFFASLLQEADIVLLDDATPFPTVQDDGPQNQRLVLSSAKIVKGHRKKQFLEFLAYNTNARPDTFALPNISRRTIQRWQSAADHSQKKYGTPIWGLIERPRPGRPRDELPAEMRAEMTAIANELYFTKEDRSVCFVWRVLRKRREARGLLCPSKGALRRHINKLKNLEESTALRKGKGASYKYSSAEVVGKNWATASDFPLKTAQMDGKTLDVVVVDDETGQPLGKPTLALLSDGVSCWSRKATALQRWLSAIKSCGLTNQ
jgi:putative transposase